MKFSERKVNELEYRMLIKTKEVISLVYNYYAGIGEGGLTIADYQRSKNMTRGQIKLFYHIKKIWKLSNYDLKTSNFSEFAEIVRENIKYKAKNKIYLLEKNRI